MRTILATCSALAVAGAVMAAQTPEGSPSAQQTITSIKVTGCLKGSDAASATSSTQTAPAGSATGTPAAGRTMGAQYTLTNVEHGAGSPPASTPGASSSTGGSAGITSGTAGATAAVQAHGAASRTTQGSPLALRADNATINFAPHVNHKVQLTGTMGASTAPGAPSPATPGTDLPVFSVTALQMVAAACP